MGRYIVLTCPFCNTQLGNSGYGGHMPKIDVPFIRCSYCGKLVNTGVREFLTIPPEERISLRNTIEICKQIERSLDRTNNKAYISFLESYGYEIYPITDEDKMKFTKTNFEYLQYESSTREATSSLYKLGILIRDEDLDDETGGWKQEIIKENKKEYDQSKKISRWSIGVGFTVGLLLAVILGSIDPDGYLFIIGIILGVGTGIGIALGMDSYYKNNKNNKNICKKPSSKEKNIDEIESKINYLKKLYNEGIITKGEFKEKALKIIDDNKDWLFIFTKFMKGFNNKKRGKSLFLFL